MDLERRSARAVDAAMEAGSFGASVPSGRCALRPGPRRGPRARSAEGRTARFPPGRHARRSARDGPGTVRARRGRVAPVRALTAERRVGDDALVVLTIAGLQRVER